MIFARDALRIAIATERSGLEFYTRAARITQDQRGRTVFQKLAEEEKEHLGTLEARYAQLLKMDPQLESRPTFLFFKGAANGLFAEGADRLTKGVNDQQALLIGIRCERGSHRFFKKYGERFEDSEGKQIFMEFAEEEKQHLELLIREYKSLDHPQRAPPARQAGKSPPPRQRLTDVDADPSGVIDLHLHTTASDGLCEPAVLVDLAWRAGIRTMSVTDHDTIAGLSGGGERGDRRRDRVRARHRDHGRARRPRRPRARLLHRSGRRGARGVSRAAARRSRSACQRAWPTSSPTWESQSIGRRCLRRGHAADRWAARWSPGRWSRPGTSPTRGRRSISSSAKASRRSSRASGPGPAEVIAIINRAGGVASLAHPGLLKRDDLIPAMVDAGLTAVEAFHSEHDPATTEHYLALADRHGILVSGGSDYHGEKERRRAAFGTVGLPRDRFERLAARGKRES